MRHTIKTTHYSLTPDANEYLEEKLLSLEKLMDSDAVVEIELGRITEGQLHGRIWRAECNIDVAGRVLRAVAIDETLHAAIDTMKDDIAAQLKKSNAKEASLMRRSGAKVKEWLKFGQDY